MFGLVRQFKTPEKPIKDNEQEMLIEYDHLSDDHKSIIHIQFNLISDK